MPVPEVNDEYKAHVIKTMGKERDNEARELLTRAAAQVQPIMRSRKWKVKKLSEFYPKNDNLLGLNVNRGAEVKVRLRPAGRINEFYPYEDILGTLLHELTHIKVSPHNQDFYKLLDTITQECEDLMSKGITGTGQGFDAPSAGKLGGRTFMHNPPEDRLRQVMLEASERRSQLATLMPTTGGRKLGGDKRSTRTLTPQQAAARAAERRMRDNVWCGADKEVSLVENDVSANSQKKPLRRSSNSTTTDTTNTATTTRTTMTKDNPGASVNRKSNPNLETNRSTKKKLQTTQNGTRPVERSANTATNIATATAIAIATTSNGVVPPLERSTRRPSSPTFLKPSNDIIDITSPPPPQPPPPPNSATWEGVTGGARLLRPQFGCACCSFLARRQIEVSAGVSSVVGCECGEGNTSQAVTTDTRKRGGVKHSPQETLVIDLASEDAENENTGPSSLRRNYLQSVEEDCNDDDVQVIEFITMPSSTAARRESRDQGVTGRPTKEPRFTPRVVSEWACPGCTLLNAPSVTQCVICESFR